METKIKIFETGIAEGVMSDNKKFYINKSEEEIKNKFLKTKQKIAKKYNRDEYKVVRATQKNDINNLEYPDGQYLVVEEKNLKKNDYWYEKLIADILIVPSTEKNITIGHQMADCPILIVEDRKKLVTAISHCGAKYINRELPIQTIEALEKEYHSNLEDLYVYIGSHIRKENYIYDTYPIWATNKEIWENNITKKDNKYFIDVTSAIAEQLTKKGIKHIEISPINTATDSNYYSHYQSTRGQKEKNGQNFVGFYYK